MKNKLLDIAGHRLAKARIAKGLDLDAVSKETGHTRSYLILIEHGGTELYIDTVATLCNLYGISIDSLVEPLGKAECTAEERQRRHTRNDDREVQDHG